MEFIQSLTPTTVPLRVQLNLLPGSVLALVGPVILFILLSINNLPALTARAERSAVRSSPIEHSRWANRTWSRRAKSTKRSTACLLGYNQQYERSAARSCSAECSGLGRKENTAKVRSTEIICMHAVVQPLKPPPKVFTSNTQDSSGVHPEGEQVNTYWDGLTSTCML